MFETARSILKQDPAAHSVAEVIFTYPGMQALFWHRIAQYFFQHHHPFLASLIRRHNEHRTGISIAPGAQIGKRVFIDHGLGTVIGDTVIIEDDVVLLHGVTLGSRRIEDTGRRHPHIKQGVYIGSNAEILGPVTIGKNSKIGAGAVVLHDVPDYATAVGNPARIIEHNGE
ncbi:serine acetyltransferase [Tetragenococcus halophilus subsp. halophilus]|uniref:serine O-acetyltransferase EpsC n=1 Tax=Tetragenococcus halophilus TaxID=51669 RepID=UPI000CC5F80F|nr:serine O-acetyltransferase EpsC [Tetragenococcus halophilus]GBD80558.1 serine acetyltransferase [Tetragenococcus halophilus subsp. halophilus]GBD81604.1 serine acetyltransferase [Tetragenococcus halophilus subsp. halophilus]